MKTKIRIYTAYFELSDKSVIIRKFTPEISAEVFYLKDKNEASGFFQDLKSRMNKVGYIAEYAPECFAVKFESTKYLVSKLKKQIIISNALRITNNLSQPTRSMVAKA